MIGKFAAGIWPLRVEASLPHGNAAMLTFGQGAEGLEIPNASPQCFAVKLCLSS